MTAPALMVTSRLIATRRFPWAACVLCILLYAVLVLIGFNDIEEDAFIYFRFAANIADGYGYVFNHGGEHIESCSGLLWLGLLLLLYHLPLHIVLSTKLLCFVLGSACIGLMCRLSHRFVMDRRLVVFPPLMMVVSIPFYVWSVRGLETALFWLGVLWLLDWITSVRWRDYWALPALVVLNSRPEGFLYVAAVLPYLFWGARKGSAVGRNVLCVAVVMVGITVWRFWYFHDLVPHPFYLKANTNIGQNIQLMLQYGWFAGWPVLLALALPGVLRRWKPDDMALTGLLLASVFWNVYVMEDKAFNRHIGLLAFLLNLFCMMMLVRWLPVKLAVRRAVVTGLFCLCAVSLLFGRYVHFQDSHRGPFLSNVLQATGNAGEYWPRVWRLWQNPDQFETSPSLGIFSIRYNLISAVGDFVRMNYAPTVRVVYDQVGQAPWYAGKDVTFIDNLGLCDRAIGLLHFQSRIAGSLVYGQYERGIQWLLDRVAPSEYRQMEKDTVLAHMLASQPDVLIVRKPYLQNRSDSVLADFLRLPAVQQQYRARWLLNGRELVFERIHSDQLLPVHHGQPQVPPGSTVQSIKSFTWCEPSRACWEVGHLTP